MPGSSVLHYLPEFAQIHIHWVGDAIQPSHPLSSPSPLAFNLSHHQNVAPSASLFPVNIQCWFPIGLTSLISFQSNGLSRVFSSTTVWKHQFFGAQPSLGLTLTSIHDSWKNHSFNYKDLCRQSDVSLLFNTLSMFVISFLPRSKHLLISWLQSPSAVSFWSPRR